MKWFTIAQKTRYSEEMESGIFCSSVTYSTAVSIGATLYTENISHFKIIAKFMSQLKVEYL